MIQRDDKLGMKDFLELSKEVKDALATGFPVVALESTIISHGMPFPENLETAQRVEGEVRTHGAIPATIAVMDGKLKAGLTEAELERLAKGGQGAIKCSRRDLPVVLARSMDGATTVAGTMIVADLAGIRIFATGGIGGVHRGAQESFDISADLQELAKTDVAVVCAGAKSILDLGLTLEYLETQGVAVLGLKTQELPAFFTRESGFQVDYRIDTLQELASIMKIKWSLGLHGGIVLANPIPEDLAMPKGEMDLLIEQALDDARQRGITGKEMTPFLLARITELSGGRSLESNIALVLNNARVAADLAGAYAALMKDTPKVSVRNGR